MPPSAAVAIEPPHDCTLCPRLSSFIAEQRLAHPDWHNGPVPTFSAAEPELLIVGLAPGLKGANKTGRPFTGDYAGDLLYQTLLRFGWAMGTYDRRPDDGIRLKGVAITNAVRCVPPQNKPVGAEIATCNRFLSATINASNSVRVLLALGRIAHEAVLRALGEKRSAYSFGHGSVHPLPGGQTLISSYHCSRYNVNTGRLTEEMFEDVFKLIDRQLGR